MVEQAERDRRRVCRRDAAAQRAACYYGALFVHDRDRLATDAGSCLSAARRGAEAARAADALFVSADGSRRVPDRAAVSVRRVDHRGGHVHESFYDERLRGRRAAGQHLAHIS